MSKHDHENTNGGIFLPTLYFQEGQFSLTKTSTNDGKFSFDNALELTKPGENVRAAVKKIKESGESLFSYAVLSGNTDAVQLVHDLIVNLFGDRKKDVSAHSAYARAPTKRRTRPALLHQSRMNPGFQVWK